MPTSPVPCAGSLAAPPPLPSHVAVLLGAEAYPHSAEDIRLHETHISWVVLAGAYAYKVKKPVDLGFLNFADRRRRSEACVEEVRLNRRLCPDLYLGVAWLVESAGRFRLDLTPTAGARAVVGEPVVRMRRLPETGMLPDLLTRGEVDARLMRRLAGRLARFHATAATGAGVDEHGSPAAISANWEENFRQMASFVGRALSPATQAAIQDYVSGFLATQAGLLARRVRERRVRDGHGDLHGGNICVDGRRLYLFDCLEFSPRYRCADVAAEVAFLAMDLEHHGRADLAAAFVDGYVRQTGDGDLLALLDFYQCYRACVRGKVYGLRLDEPGLSPARQREIARAASAYFDLARTYAGERSHPTLVMTIGLPASGKTSLAHALAGRLGLVHILSDVTRKELAHLRPATRQTAAYGEGLYRADAKRRTYGLMRRRAARWLRRGRSVVLDATYGDAAEREAVRRLAFRLGVRLVPLLCRVDESTIRARLAARAHDPFTASDARLELWPALRSEFQEPIREPGAHVVEMSAPLEAAADAAMAVITGEGWPGGEPLPEQPPGEPRPHPCTPAPAEDVIVKYAGEHDDDGRAEDETERRVRVRREQ